MAVSPILWLDDRNHLSVADTTFSASTVANGFNADNAREADLVKAWKPSDGTGDEYLMTDGGSATWLGSAGATAWCLVAYDARGADQVEINLQEDTADSSSGSFATNKAAFTLGASEVSCAFASFTISTSGRQYYRLYQYNSDRASGTVPAKILYWAMVGESGVVRINSTGYASDALAPYSIREIDRQGVVDTVGAIFTNRWAATGQSFTVPLDPATVTAWQALRTKLRSSGGIGRSYFVQFEGLSNPGGTSNFFLCRPTTTVREASVPYDDNYRLEIEMETERWV